MKLIPLPAEPTPDMVSAAFMIIENLPKGTEARHKRMVVEVWKAMVSAAPGPRTGGITPRQRIALEIIADYIQEHGISPTYREIGAQMGKPSVSDVAGIIRSLKKRGFITKADGRRRSLRILIHPGTQTKGK